MKFILALMGLGMLSGTFASSVSLASAEEQYYEWELYASPRLTYQYVTDQVFRPRCYKCHSDQGGNKGKVNLETYEHVYALRTKIYKVAIVRKIMPPKRAGGPLSAQEMEILGNWLMAGAPMSAEYE